MFDSRAHNSTSVLYMFYNHICFDDFNHLKIIQVIKLYSIIIIDNCEIISNLQKLWRQMFCRKVEKFCLYDSFSYCYPWKNFYGLFWLRLNELKSLNEVWSNTVFVYEYFLANKYVYKVHDGNANARCEICSKPIIKAPEQHLWCNSFFLFKRLHKERKKAKCSKVHGTLYILKCLGQN